MKRLASLLAITVALSACSTLIDGRASNDFDPAMPDSGLGDKQDNPDGEGEGDDDPNPVEEGSAVLLAPASNSDLREVGLLSAEDGTPLGPFIRYADFPALEASSGYPQAAAQHPNGNVFVLDPVMDTIYIFSPEAELLATRGFSDLEIGEAPRSLDFYGDEVWYTTNKGRVGRIDANGKSLTPILNLPEPERLEDLLVLSDGRFLVSNATVDQVQLFDSDGSKIRDVYGINSPEQLQQIGPDEFVVSAYIDDAIATFTLNGTELSRIDNLERAQGVAPLSNGNWAITIRTLGQACSVGNECLIQEFGGVSAPIGTLSDGPLVRRLEPALLVLD